MELYPNAGGIGLQLPQQQQQNWTGFGNYLGMSQPTQMAPVNYDLLSGIIPNTQLSVNPALTSGGTNGTGNKDGILGWLQGTGFMGKDGQQGWGGLALGSLNGIGSAYMGMKQYGLAKDSLQMQKDQFALNYGAQQKSYNSQLEDRQRARVAATGGSAESVESYMARNKI